MSYHSWYVTERISFVLVSIKIGSQKLILIGWSGKNQLIIKAAITNLCISISI